MATTTVSKGFVGVGVIIKGCLIYLWIFYKLRDIFSKIFPVEISSNSFELSLGGHLTGAPREIFICNFCDMMYALL